MPIFCCCEGDDERLWSKPEITTSICLSCLSCLSCLFCLSCWYGCLLQIHPRAKEWVGRRLALAARAVAYGDTKTVYTGPVLSGCKLSPSRGGPDDDSNMHGSGDADPLITSSAGLSVTIQFNRTLLRGDGVISHGDAIENYDRDAMVLCAGNALCKPTGFVRNQRDQDPQIGKQRSLLRSKRNRAIAATRRVFCEHLAHRSSASASVRACLFLGHDSFCSSLVLTTYCIRRCWLAPGCRGNLCL